MPWATTPSTCSRGSSTTWTTTRWRSCSATSSCTRATSTRAGSSSGTCSSSCWRRARSAATSTIDDDTKQAIAGLVVVAGATAYQSGYGRGMEDQADRVGLRYAYEAGYDITKGPRLWNRFAKKYGEGNKVANFFFSDHSQSAARATKLEKEIAYNYPDGPKPDGPVRQARRPEAPARTVTVAATPAGVPASAQALPPLRRRRASPRPRARSGGRSRSA